jgi:hypothetical protein
MLYGEVNGIDKREFKLAFLSVLRRPSGLCIRRTAYGTINKQHRSSR